MTPSAQSNSHIFSICYIITRIRQQLSEENSIFCAAGSHRFLLIIIVLRIPLPIEPNITPGFSSGPWPRDAPLLPRDAASTTSAVHRRCGLRPQAPRPALCRAFARWRPNPRPCRVNRPGAAKLASCERLSLWPLPMVGLSVLLRRTFGPSREGLSASSLSPQPDCGCYSFCASIW